LIKLSGACLFGWNRLARGIDLVDRFTEKQKKRERVRERGKEKERGEKERERDRERQIRI